MKNNKHKKHYFNWVPFLFVLVIILFLCILIGPEKLSTVPAPVNQQSEVLMTVLPSPTIVPTATDLPEDYPNLPREYFENENETEGIILGGTILVIIILLGVIISKHNNEKQE